MRVGISLVACLITAATATTASAGDFTVTFESVNQPGNFMSANDAANGWGLVLRPWIGGWEVFTLTDINNGTLSSGDDMTLLTFHNQFVNINPNVSSLPTGQQPLVGGWEQLDIVKVSTTPGPIVPDGTCQTAVLTMCSSCDPPCFPTYNGLTYTGCRRWTNQFCSVQCPL